MDGRELSAALRSGRRVYGTLITSDSPRWVSAVEGLQLDYVFLDTEHVPIDRRTLAWMCQAYRGIGAAPIVRIPSPDPYAACMVLDGRAAGIIAPYVESPDQVRALRGAVKLRPLKGRRLRRILAGQEQPEPRLAEYLAERNASSVLIVNIESRPAMDALDDILAVDGLDAVLIGPHDLSLNLGVPEEYFSRPFEQAVEQIITTARAAGVGAGIHVIYPGAIEQEARWAEMGANLILHGADVTAFREAMQADLRKLKAALGDAGESAGGRTINV